jgi:hypothetical protein
MQQYKRQTLEENNRAIDIIADYWLNSEPVFFENLRGSVVLLLFFNYASAEWIELYKYVREWERRYKDKGLFILGVHVPKFPFETKIENVENEIKHLKITFPVAIDNDWRNLKRYASLIAKNFTFDVPCIFLVNRDGLISYSYFGVGRLWEIEFYIQSLLIKAGYYGDFPLPIGSRYEIDEFAFYKVTPEILTCYSGGALGNAEGFAPESVLKYEDPKIYVNGKFYLDGEWYNGKYYFKHNPISQSFGTVILPYAGVNVGVVAESLNGENLKVIVIQDEEFLNEYNCGDDVKFEDGESFIVVDRPRFYNVVKNPDFGEHILKLIVDSPNFAIYKFSISAHRFKRELITEF